MGEIIKMKIEIVVCDSIIPDNQSMMNIMTKYIIKCKSEEIIQFQGQH